MPPDLAVLDAMLTCPRCLGSEWLRAGCERCGGRGEVREFPAHVGRVVRQAVTVEAKNATREQSNALADRTGRAVAREIALMLKTKRAPDEPREPSHG